MPLGDRQLSVEVAKGAVNEGSEGHVVQHLCQKRV